MEFHGAVRVIDIGALQVSWNSMEFHGTARVIDIGALQVPRNSMEFHGTPRVIEIGVLQVPWNSMIFLYLIEPFVSSILSVLNLDRIPCNFEFPNYDDNYIQFCR